MKPTTNISVFHRIIDMGDRDRSSDRGARVYVGGLSETVKKEDLEGEFEKFGKLDNVWIALNPPGFAFVTFVNLSDAENACDNLNGIDFLGSKLRVEIAKGRSRGGGRFRGGGRGGGGRGGSGGFGRDGGRGFRGSPRGGRGGGGGRYFDGGRGGDFRGPRDDSRFGGRDFNRRSDGYDREGGRGAGGPPRRFEGNQNYRSRSPMSGGQRH